MFMRVLAPPRPAPVPVSGTFLSLTAHAALLAATAGGGSADGADAAARADARRAASGERLHWVGLGEGSGGRGVRPRRSSALPPLAYVIPGTGGLRMRAAGDDGARGAKGGRGDPGGARRRAAERAEAAAARRPTERMTPMSVRLPAVPEVAVAEAQATLLVAGVLSSAPDEARRAARPEEFAPAPASELMADLLVRTGQQSTLALRPEARPHDLPIPFKGNPMPKYPPELARARVNGHVVVEFKVDSTGVVDAGTLRVVTSTDERFTEAVRTVLPRLRFAPAQRGESPVGVTVLQPFLFTMRPGL